MAPETAKRFRPLAPHDEPVDNSSESADEKLPAMTEPTPELLHIVITAHAAHQRQERVGGMKTTADRQRSPVGRRAEQPCQDQHRDRHEQPCDQSGQNPFPIARSRVMA